jgi:hypothetical protein
MAVVEEKWNHTAQLHAALLSVHSGKPVSPHDLHPFRRRPPSNPQRDSDELGRYIEYHKRRIDQQKPNT